MDILYEKGLFENCVLTTLTQRDSPGLPAFSMPHYITLCKSTHLCAMWHAHILEWMMEGNKGMVFYYASLDLLQLHFCMQSLHRVKLLWLKMLKS